MRGKKKWNSNRRCNKFQQNKTNKKFNNVQEQVLHKTTRHKHKNFINRLSYITNR